jgi:hypothetical protein
MTTNRGLGVLAAAAVAAIVSGGVSTAAADDSGSRTSGEGSKRFPPTARR